MSYKVRIEYVYANTFVIRNIGTETISIKLYTSSGETSSYFIPNGQYTISSQKAAIFGSSNLTQVFGFIGNSYLTVFTKKGFITEDMSNSKVNSAFSMIFPSQSGDLDIAKADYPANYAGWTASCLVTSPIPDSLTIEDFNNGNYPIYMFYVRNSVDRPSGLAIYSKNGKLKFQFIDTSKGDVQIEITEPMNNLVICNKTSSRLGGGNSQSQK